MSSWFVRSLMFVAVFALCGMPALAAGSCGEFSEVQGTVILVKPDGSDVPAADGLPFDAGDRVRAAATAACSLDFDDGSVVHLEGAAEASIDRTMIDNDLHDSELTLYFGRLLASIIKRSSTRMKVKTPVAVAAVRGTEFAIEMTSDTATVGVFDGSVAVTDAAGTGEVVVNPEQETSVIRMFRPRPPMKLRWEMLKNRERILRVRDEMRVLRARQKDAAWGQRHIRRDQVMDRMRRARLEREKPGKRPHHPVHQQKKGERRP